MTARRDTTLLMMFFFVSVFIQNATVSIGTVQIGFFIVPVGLFIAQVVRGRLPLVKTRHFWVLGLFLGYVVLRTATSPNFGEALVVLVYLSLDAMVLLMCYTFVLYARETGQESRIILSINALMTVSILIYLYLYVRYDPAELAENFELLREENIRLSGSFWDVKSYTQVEGTVLRFNGFYYDPNAWGLYSFTGLYIVTILKLSQTPALTQPFSLAWLRGYLPFVPSVLSALFTFSRGTMLGLLMVCVAVLLNVFANNPRQGLRLLLGTLVALGLVTFGLVPLLFGDSVLETLLINKTTGDLDADTLARPLIWRTYLGIFADWPIYKLLFGVGMNRRFYEDVGFFMATHNYVLQLAAMLGLVGLGLHVLMCAYLARLLAWARRQFPAHRLRYGIGLSFLLGILLISFFIDPLYQFPFWMYSGVTFGMIQHDQFRNVSRPETQHRLVQEV